MSLCPEASTAEQLQVLLRTNSVTLGNFSSLSLSFLICKISIKITVIMAGVVSVVIITETVLMTNAYFSGFLLG